MTSGVTSLVIGLTVSSAMLCAQTPQPGLGQGWMPEFEDASQQLVSLAEATPAEKFNWRPAPGVRSVAEVYMHVAIANYYLMGQAGTKIPAEIMARLKPETEKTVTAKNDVIQWLKNSQEFVRGHYASVDKQKKLKFFDKDTTAEGILLRLLVHDHEHMGQSVAYARMIGVVPPWSK